MTAFYWALGITSALGLGFTAFAVYSAKGALASEPATATAPRLEPISVDALTSVGGRLNATVVRS